MQQEGGWGRWYRQRNQERIMEEKWMIRMGSLWQCDRNNGDSEVVMVIVLEEDGCGV